MICLVSSGRLDIYLVYSVDISKVFVTNFVIPVWITILNETLYKELAKKSVQSYFCSGQIKIDRLILLY